MNINLQAIALGGIVGAICVAFLAVIIAGIIGRPVDDATRLYTFGLFTSLATTAATWLAASKTNSAVNAAMYQAQRAEIESLKAQVK